ncbi:MAG TPA: AAA family ATPase [Candidatus Polarisedimenticolia bacterium]|nr:AAA family ATPase [Candidatus Polarisedimenticolia bacterium]
MTDLANDAAGMAIGSRDAVRAQKGPEPLVDTLSRQQRSANDPMTDITPSSSAATLKLRVAEARVEDIGRAVARLAPIDLQRMGARAGDVVKITGSAVAVGRAELSENGHEGMIQIDGTCRSNCGAGLQEQVTVSRIDSEQAVAVRFSPLWVGAAPATIAPDRILEDLVGVPVIAGCVVRVPTFAKAVNFQVVRTIPSGPVVIGKRTDIRIVEGDQTVARAPAVSYEDIGGLEREVARVREIVELPLKYSRIFERLGILAPKGVLLYGPPGTGKTLLARAVAAESRVHFIHLNGPEIMRKFYGESEAKLREVFEEAARHAPSILFIDEIDAVAPKRTEVVGEVEKRVVAQLLSLMDGFVARGQVIVIGATNIPEVLDPALRRPGRFDREIEIGVPNTQARLQILRIHTRAMPLAADVDLPEIAEHSHGFVGADLEALGQEVGMIALRRFLSSAPLDTDGIAAEELGSLQVTRDDFLAGLKEVEPSATREFFIEKSSSTFSSLGGLNEVKRLLDGVVEHSHMRDEIYEQVGLAPPRGILLAGPSGTGKTAMARALSGEKQIPLIAIDGPQLYSKWLGESERALREVFKKARRAAPCILFFDTIDAVAPRFGADQFGSDIYQRILSQLLREIDNLRDVKGVILLAASNRPERIDPALLRSGRFDYILQFAKPNAADRATIMRLCCRRVPLALDVDFEDFAARTEGLTGADIESLCKKATLLAIVELQDGTRPAPFVVLRSDFLAVLESDRGSPDELKNANEPGRNAVDSCSDASTNLSNK